MVGQRVLGHKSSCDWILHKRKADGMQTTSSLLEFLGKAHTEDANTPFGKPAKSDIVEIINRTWSLKMIKLGYFLL